MTTGRVSSPVRVKYRDRISSLLKKPALYDSDGVESLELQAHWAKYVCVLVSGYMEQSIKEIFLEYGSNKSVPAISHYIEKSWPTSKNMNYGNILDIFGKFDANWKHKVELWVDADQSRKSEINGLISWRNFISHGNESNTNGVTLHAVTYKFKIACDLIDFLEKNVE